MEGCSRNLCSAACSLDVQSVGEKSASGHLRKRNARKLERRARLGDFERAVLGHHVIRRHRPSHADLQVPLLVETLRIRVDSQVQVRVDRQELISHLARRRGRVDHHELLGVLGSDARLERIVQRHLSEFSVGRRVSDVDIDKAAQGVAPPRTHGRRQSPGRGEPCPALRDASQRACAGCSRVLVYPARHPLQYECHFGHLGQVHNLLLLFIIGARAWRSSCRSVLLVLHENSFQPAKVCHILVFCRHRRF